MEEKRKGSIAPNFSLDDFFTTQEERDESKKEKIEDIDISLIDNFPKHPFKVVNNDELNKLKDSIKTNGLLEPIIIRPKENGRYELISGHRRKKASELLGLKTIKAVVRDLTDDEATIYMVDSNLHREKLLPSEKAFAYKMKLDAIRHQGRTYGPQDPKLETSRPLVDKSKSADIVGKDNSESGRQVQRYIRLTYLTPELLQYVDNSELKESPSIALRPAVELSYLSKEEQQDLKELIDYNLATPSLAQAIKLKKLSQEGTLTADKMESILEEEKANQKPKIRFNEKRLKEVLPNNIKDTEIEDYVIKSVDFYTKHRYKDLER